MFAFFVLVSLNSTPAQPLEMRHGMACGAPQALQSDAVQTVRLCTTSLREGLAWSNGKAGAR